MNIAVVFWSGTGNTASLAESVAQGAKEKGATVDVIDAFSFTSEDVAKYDAIAFGCPAMGAEELEADEFEPMFSSVESSLSGKKIVLFGSYDWGDGEWMRTWSERASGDGAIVLSTLAVNNTPDDGALSDAKALGALLA